MFGLSACGETGPSTNEETPHAEGTQPAGFPLEIEHRFGRTVIERQPKNVVAIGGGDMEAAIALGVVPVAGADWFGAQEIRPWVKSALGSAKSPELLNPNELRYERVAAKRPDLILYLNSRNEEQVYRKLAAIAPTIASDASVKNIYGVRWQDQLATIGKVLGRSDRAEQLLEETERLISDAKAANPQFAGKTITAGVYTSDSIWVWFPSDPRMRLLQQLGFVMNEKVATKDDGNFTMQVSDEQLELLESDLIFLAALDAAGKVDPGVAGNKVFQALDTVRGGHAVYWPGPATINTGTEGGAFSSAFSIGGPLGIKACLPKLVDMLNTGLRA